MFANIFRRKFRSFYQRIIIVTILLGTSIFSFSYFNLEFCYKLLSSSSLNHMCILYRENQYSGSLCEELCNGETFKDFKCPRHSMKTTVYTAVKSNDVYSIMLAKNIKDDLTWLDKNGQKRYPNIKEFQNIVKRHLFIDYNVTIDESLIQALLIQEIDGHNLEQMLNLWRLLQDHNYMIGKLYEEESIFPNIFGSCGPFYVAETLNPLETNKFKQQITLEWLGRLELAIMILDFLDRLDNIRPEPMKICKVERDFFGLTSDHRVKYQTAQYIQTELQLDKILADGHPCKTDQDCMYEQCLGKCDLKLKICNGQQQNNNLQIVCQYVFKGTTFSQGLLSATPLNTNLMEIINLCINPSKNEKLHLPNKPFAPNVDVAARLYNEIKRVLNQWSVQEE